MPRYGDVDKAYATKLATTPPEDDGPVWMVNLMRYREQADYEDGRQTSRTGREADDEYAPVGPLAAVGAKIVFVGDVADQFIGQTPRWDRVAVVRYPTRRSFIEMQQRKDFQKQHEHKEAGMAETIVIGGQPIEIPTITNGPDWADVPHPPTDDDGPYTMVHVIRFHDEGGATATPDHMTEYQNVAGSVAVPNGVRIDGWFSAEGTILGDGRSWHQVRFNTFPSKAAFMTVAMDPDRLAAHSEHRDTAIADTYAIGVRGYINHLADSIAEPHNG
ncbi:MAG: hypothetical protein AAGF73_17325 [Actinomycetota bacterium]